MPSAENKMCPIRRDPLLFLFIFITLLGLICISHFGLYTFSFEPHILVVLHELQCAVCTQWRRVCGNTSTRSSATRPPTSRSFTRWSTNSRTCTASSCSSRSETWSLEALTTFCSPSSSSHGLLGILSFCLAQTTYTVTIKPGFHYPSWRAVLTLAVNSGHQLG